MEDAPLPKLVETPKKTIEEIIEIEKENKSGYSFNRPEYEHVKLVVEKEIIQAKNKELAEKKNQEEIKIYLEDYGKAKAKFNEKKEIKPNLAIETYKDILKIDKENVTAKNALKRLDPNSLKDENLKEEAKNSSAKSKISNKESSDKIKGEIILINEKSVFEKNRNIRKCL